MSDKKTKRQRIHRKIRSRIAGTDKRPRLSVFKSSQHIYAQLIDDLTGKVLVAVSDIKMKKGTKTEQATEIGRLVAEGAAKAKIETVVFDRGGFLFHGRVKAVAEGARAGGLKF